ncbi:hypothetical protein [Caldibacillus thermoamylovorans]|uniref:hypothetical protein n=1 Tax=Caldibacillus thermoamylovorans TaxID=35841 RepID=UPI00203F1C29|nr:hypothetical protein [Caldibacillus thermoamylovorans]MCM3479298.1 hypothetical protein [Caldibacillus thermoamylovorans]
MPQFYETGNGKRFLEGQLPQLLNALDTIAHELRRQNDITEGKHIKRIADEIAVYEPNFARLLDEYMK